MHDYLEIIDANVAKLLADSMYTFNEDAVRKVLDDLEEAGADECFLNTATAEMVEIDRIAEIVAKRG